MSTRIFLLFLLCGITQSIAATNDEPIRVFMPDGQIKSHLLRIFVTKDFTQEDRPVLVPIPGQLFPKTKPTWAEKPITAYQLSRFQHWREGPEGQEVTYTGTLLLFDLRALDFPRFKASVRITPVIKWANQVESAVGEHPVYIGNRVGAFSWTGIAMALLLGILYVFSRPFGLKGLLASPDGRLSLSKTQAAAWTLAIGAMVFFFGLLRFETPVIPETLVGLMGLSLATRALSYVQETKNDQNQPDIKGDPGQKHAPQLRDLIYTGDQGKSVPSITKAQMLFWTCLVITLFSVKTVIDGVLWQVPWQLVFLMGMSQATYMVPKFIPRDQTTPDKPASDKPAPRTETTR